MTTTAPTFEELPPEKGSILELHSIGDAYDGKIVAYEKADKEHAGKIFVVLFNGDASEGMRVKLKCCRRPDIKPLLLRKVLFNLSEEIVREALWSSTTHELEQHTARMKKLFEKDPCCVPAHHALAVMILRKEEDDDGYNSETLGPAIYHLRLAMANFFAYREEVKDDDFTLIHGLLSALVVQHRGLKSAARLIQGSISSKIETNSAVFMINEHILGRNLAARATKETGEQRNSKETNMLMAAAEHFFNVFKAGASDQANKHVPFDMIVRESVSYTRLIMLYLFQDYCSLQRHDFARLKKALEAFQESSEYTETIEVSSELNAARERANRICEKWMASCTTQDGTIKFIDDELIADIKERKQLLLDDKVFFDKMVTEMELESKKGKMRSILDVVMKATETLGTAMVHMGEVAKCFVSQIFQFCRR